MRVEGCGCRGAAAGAHNLGPSVRLVEFVGFGVKGVGLQGVWRGPPRCTPYRRGGPARGLHRAGDWALCRPARGSQIPAPATSTDPSARPVEAASERIGNNLKGFEDF